MMKTIKALTFSLAILAHLTVLGVNGFVEGQPNAPTAYFTPEPEVVNPFSSASDCQWTTNTGYTLDLSNLYGSILTYSSALLSYVYYYSPCNDGVICTQNGTNLDTMAIQDSNGFCVSYLAKFDRTVIPTYAESSQTFTFEYNNGEISDICDDSRELVVTWQCGNSMARIKSVEEIASCIYKLSVSSYLACMNETSLTTTTTTMHPETTQIPHGCKFGMYNVFDEDAISDDGWKRVSLDDFNDHKSIFVAYYNKNEGIDCIKSWSCGNCCFATDEDSYLTVVNGNMDNYNCDVFPATAPATTQCCPSASYNEGETYIFYRKNYGQYLTSLVGQNLTFGEVDRCSNSNNPGVYQKNCW